MPGGQEEVTLRTQIPKTRLSTASHPLLWAPRVEGPSLGCGWFRVQEHSLGPGEVDSVQASLPPRRPVRGSARRPRGGWGGARGWCSGSLRGRPRLLPRRCRRCPGAGTGAAEAGDAAAGARGRSARPAAAKGELPRRPQAPQEEVSGRPGPRSLGLGRPSCSLWPALPPWREQAAATGSPTIHCSRLVLDGAAPFACFLSRALSRAPAARVRSVRPGEARVTRRTRAPGRRPG